MEPKILEEDRDEWIYNSMKRYSNLYMFELEFPADVFEVIDTTTICLSGCQPYSKKTEILQLALPPKLFPKDIEEGLCKDRDFQIVSGGYASNPILQIKPIKSSTSESGRSLVVTTQSGENALTLYQLGNADTAVIQEFCKLPLNPGGSSHCFENPKQSPGQIGTTGSSIYLSSSTSQILEWDLNTGISPESRPLPHKLGGQTGEKVTKMKVWDVNATPTEVSNPSTIFLLGEDGVVLLVDLRLSSSPMSFTSTRSRSEIVDEPEASAVIVDEDSEAPGSSSSEILYTFDTTASIVGILDSCGGYETFDIRTGSIIGARTLLPGGGGSILRETFNLQYSPVVEATRESSNPLFLVSGLDCSAVPVLQALPGKEGQGEVGSIFVHDGHFKRVSASVWHPSVDKLVFSASVDSMLHAWQYII